MFPVAASTRNSAVITLGKPDFRTCALFSDASIVRKPYIERRLYVTIFGCAPVFTGDTVDLAGRGRASAYPAAGRLAASVATIDVILSQIQFSAESAVGA